MTIDLSGRRALVTGGNRGIGLAVVKALAEAGANVTFTARSEAKARDGMEALGPGEKVGTIICDVTDRAAMRAALDTPFDILVNNAGIVGPIGRIDEVSIEEVAQNIDTNLIGAFHAMQLAIRQMVPRGGGTIVNVSSGAAHQPIEGWSAYCAGKAGLAMAMRAVHHEFADKGIRAFGFAPGVVDTEMQVEIRASGINPVSKLKRTDLAPAHEPARAIAWLCTDAADRYRGEEIDVRNDALRQAAGLEPLG